MMQIEQSCIKFSKCNKRDIHLETHVKKNLMNKIIQCLKILIPDRIVKYYRGQASGLRHNQSMVCMFKNAFSIFLSSVYSHSFNL